MEKPILWRQLRIKNNKTVHIYLVLREYTDPQSRVDDNRLAKGSRYVLLLFGTKASDNNFNRN